MKVSDFLNEEFIIAELKGRKKEDVINELINLFSDDPRVIDLEEVRKAVFEREKVMSTGVGKGFAIPHGKTDAIKEIIAAFGKSTEPIEFEALDGNPVHLVFLIVGKENIVSTNIKLLSRISRMMNKDDFRNRLVEAGSEKEIMDIFREEEKNYIEV